MQMLNVGRPKNLEWGGLIIRRKKIERKPSEELNKVHFDTGGKLVIGETLLGKMLEAGDIDRRQLIESGKTNLWCFAGCALGKRSSKTSKYNNKQQVYIWFEICETEKKGLEATGHTAGEKNWVRQFNITNKRSYQNVYLVEQVHEIGRSTKTDFQQFMWRKEEEKPIKELDEPIVDRETSELITEYQVTRTDITAKSGAIDMIRNESAIRIWVNEGERIHEPLRHKPWQGSGKK